jgi:hypothetical protein
VVYLCGICGVECFSEFSFTACSLTELSKWDLWHFIESDFTSNYITVLPDPSLLPDLTCIL